MLTFKSFSGEQFQLPFEESITLRQFMIKHAASFPQTSRDENSFFWSFIKEGKHVNTFNNRNNLLSEFFKVGDTIYINLWIFGGPTCHSLFKNNLTGNDMVRDFTQCSICLEPLNDKDHIYSSVLSCSHCFHALCLEKQTECPLCRKTIVSSELRSIAYLCRCKNEYHKN